MASEISEPIEMESTRLIYTQQQFDNENLLKEKNEVTFSHNLRRKIQDKFSVACVKDKLYNFFPVIQLLRNYNIREDAVGDLISGLTVGIMNIPQAMGYALLASLPPIYGLYMSFFAPVVYFFFGTSRHISIGTFAIVSLMVGNVVESQENYCSAYAMNEQHLSQGSAYTNHTPSTNSTVLAAVLSDSASPFNHCKIGIAGALTFLVGISQLLMGLFNVGFITVYLSDPLVSAFTCACSYHVFTSQMKYALGITIHKSSGAFQLIKTYIEIFRNITGITWAAFGLFSVSVVLLLAVKMGINDRFKKKLKIPIPIDLVIVAIATLVSYYMQLHEKYHVHILEDIPAGFPKPVVPPLQKAPEIIVAALELSIVAVFLNLSTAKLFAKKNNYDIDANQELVAYGLCNILCSFFQCFTSAASLSRSAVQDSTGGRTQVAGLISAIMILVVLLAIAPYLTTLPVSVLAAIIVVALKNVMTQFTELKRLWFISKYDFSIWLVTFVSVIVLDVDLGLCIGVIFGLLTIVFRSQFPKTVLYGHIPHTDLYKDKNVYATAQDVPGIKIFHVESPLYFANAEYIRKKIYDLTEVDPREIKRVRDGIEKNVQKEVEAVERVRRRLVSVAQTILNDANAVDSLASDDDEILVPARSRPEWPEPEQHHIIIDCAMMSFLDSVGVDTLKSIYQEYRDIDVTVYLANCQGCVTAMLKRCNFHETVPEENIYLTIHDAVMSARPPSHTILSPLVQIHSQLELSTIRRNGHGQHTA